MTEEELKVVILEYCEIRSAFSSLPDYGVNNSKVIETAKQMEVNGFIKNIDHWKNVTDPSDGTLLVSGDITSKGAEYLVENKRHRKIMPWLANN